ncbi:MAG: thioredoxin domain-containing protein [Chloroflexota bacterium]
MRERPQPPLSRRDRRTQERLDRPQKERPHIAPSRSRRPLWRSPLILVTVGAVFVAGAVILLNQRPLPTNTGGDLLAPTISYTADIVDGEALGRSDAPVVLEVYSDFQCPVCARFVRDQFPTLKTLFVDTGILRIESRDIAILGSGDRDESLELATGARCAAAQDRYWQFHDLVFWNQGAENRGDHSPEYLAAVANRAGVDRTAWDACMADDTVRNALRTESAAALRAGFNSTPTLVLNGGTPVPGLPDPAALIARIQELAAAASPTASAAP